MNRRFLKRLQASFAKRGGTFGIPPGVPPEMLAALLTDLLECPECREAVLEACNPDGRRDVDMDEVLRGLVMRSNH